MALLYAQSAGADDKASNWRTGKKGAGDAATPATGDTLDCDDYAITIAGNGYVGVNLKTFTLQKTGTGSWSLNNSAVISAGSAVILNTALALGTGCENDGGILVNTGGSFTGNGFGNNYGMIVMNGGSSGTLVHNSDQGCVVVCNGSSLKVSAVYYAHVFGGTLDIGGAMQLFTVIGSGGTVNFNTGSSLSAAAFIVGESGSALTAAVAVTAGAGCYYLQYASATKGGAGSFSAGLSTISIPITWSDTLTPVTQLLTAQAAGIILPANSVAATAIQTAYGVAGTDAGQVATRAADATTLTNTTLDADGTDTTVAFGASNATAKTKAVYDAGYAAGEAAGSSGGGGGVGAGSGKMGISL